jgi:transcriptional regulator with XRE-family HTH domain
VVDYVTLATQLKDLRMARRWTLHRAAGAAALTATAISRIETHRRVPSIDHLVALSGA